MYFRGLALFCYSCYSAFNLVPRKSGGIVNINEVRLYSSQGKDATIDSAKVVVEGQEFILRLIDGKVKVVSEPFSPVRAWRSRAKAIARDRITKANVCQNKASSTFENVSQ